MIAFLIGPISHAIFEVQIVRYISDADVMRDGQGIPGLLICTEVTHVSLVKPVGLITVIHSTTLFLGFAGTSVTGPSTMMSGLIAQPSGRGNG